MTFSGSRGLVIFGPHSHARVFPEPSVNFRPWGQSVHFQAVIGTMFFVEVPIVVFHSRLISDETCRLELRGHVF